MKLLSAPSLCPQAISLGGCSHYVCFLLDTILLLCESPHVLFSNFALFLISSFGTLFSKLIFFHRLLSYLPTICRSVCWDFVCSGVWFEDICEYWQNTRLRHFSFWGLWECSLIWELSRNYDNLIFLHWKRFDQNHKLLYYIYIYIPYVFQDFKISLSIQSCSRWC